MAVDRNRVVVGSAAALALILVIWWQWPSSAKTASPQASGTATGSRSRAVRAAGAAAGPVEVRLQALSGAAREEPGRAARNPFRYQAKPAPPPPKIVAPVASPPTVGPAIPAGPPPPPPIPLKLIGVLERANGVKWAVLSDGKSGTPMYGKDGDIIDGRYQIVKIGNESIEMTYADGRGRQMIRLTGQ